MMSKLDFLRRSPLTVLLFVFLGADLFWLASMPAWPSQDGPVHLYYTRVLDALLSSAPSPFRPYFFIKHLLPPYALYYYALLGLSHAMPLLTADRVVIGAYVVSFILGFRYCARAIGPNAPVTSLLASLLVMNWTLGMGFANFCLSLSFALWAMGLWLRLGRGPEVGSGHQQDLGKRLVFLLLLLLITLTHPVPLLLVLGFCGLDLACRYVAARQAWRPLQRGELRAGIVTLFFGSLLLLYVKAFTVAHPLEQRTKLPGSFLGHAVRHIKDLLIVKDVEVLYGRWWEVQLYRVSVGLILVVATLFAVQQWRSHRAEKVWTAGDSMMVYAACFLLLLPFLPSDISGAYYFFERLNLMLWLTMLLAASGWSSGPRAEAPRGGFEIGARTATWQFEGQSARATLGVAAFSIVLTVILLHALEKTLRPFAERDYQLANTELPLKGQLTMVLDGDQERKYLWAGPPWDPYYWDTVALLRHNDAIMANPPWLDSPIIPLAETSGIPGSVLPPLLANSPLFLGYRLKDTPALRSDVLDKTEVALFSPVGKGGRTAVPAMLGAGWSCDAPSGGGYRLCVRGGADTVARLYEPKGSNEDDQPQAK